MNTQIIEFPSKETDTALSDEMIKQIVNSISLVIPFQLHKKELVPIIGGDRCKTNREALMYWISSLDIPFELPEKDRTGWVLNRLAQEIGEFMNPDQLFFT